MRVLFTCRAGLGHFHPLVPFAHALAEAGHEVAFASPSQMAEVIGGLGFRYFPAGEPRSASDLFREQLTSPAGDLTVFSYPRVFQAWIFGRLFPERLAGDVLGVTEHWCPDLVVRDQMEFGGCVAAERLGIPHAAVEIHADGIPPWIRRLLTEPLRQVRAVYGLPPEAGLEMLDRYLTLSPFPPSLRDPAAPPAATLHRVRTSPFDRSGNDELPDWLSALPARPTVHLTLGTVPGFGWRPAIARAFADGLCEERLNLVVAAGPDLVPAALGAAHANVWIERYIPHSLLLPRCRVVICHGGSGTVLASILHGLPMVIVPIAAEQPRNAERGAALGVARWVPARGLTAETAREAVLDVLHGESYHQRAERLRHEILAFPGLDRAITLLERLAAERAPLIA